MTREELEKVRAWANDKIATGTEPPWAWSQYMKLREAGGLHTGWHGVHRTCHCPGKFTTRGATSGNRSPSVG